MGALTFDDGVNFDLYILDLCESMNPKKAEDLNELSEELHQRVEMAIDEYISDEGLEGEYINQY